MRQSIVLHKMRTKLPIDAKFLSFLRVPCSAQSSSPQCSQDAGAAMSPKRTKVCCLSGKAGGNIHALCSDCVHIKQESEKEAGSCLITKVTVYILSGMMHTAIKKDKRGDIEGGYFRKQTGMMTHSEIMFSTEQF
jgi:GTP cyclohydrolase III